jgi:hypothetical protein
MLIHGQFIRPDPVQQLKSLGIFPPMFPMHPKVSLQSRFSLASADCDAIRIVLRPRRW